MAKIVEATLKFAAETKGSLKYQEIDTNGKPYGFGGGTVGVQYIRKGAFGDNVAPPAMIKATFEAVEG
jgi:hypothetical protein